MIKVLFICHGNICRSTMAEFVFRDLAEKTGTAALFEIASAGVSDEEHGAGVHPGTRRMLEKHGITRGVAEKRARQIAYADYGAYDLLICMDYSNYKRCLSAFGGDPDRKLSLLMAECGENRDVADPWYTGDFEATWSDISAGCRALWERLTAGTAVL